MTMILDLYHLHLPDNPRCLRLTSKREKQLRARWREGLEANYYATERDGLEWWTRFFIGVSESSFLTGQTAPRDGNKEPFVAGLDWLTNAENHVKVLEGKYQPMGRAV